ncbi:MAG TPA: ABC transporter ATP-binding protein [Solirubrobacteraceae bacterium]|jgi:ABC-type polysaccharide/polyol phosphate transport system ATPase subunit|nr:ABC transporter ATP-binding protein [Solirubrobacteraceae bacterium]
MSKQMMLRAEHLSKTFHIPEERAHTLKERALHPLRNRRHTVLEALKDVSFEVEQGEFFGIIGRNGSGKSTMLKCIAGIYRLDEGEVWVGGRMSTFIELGVGFNPDLAAYDNVVLNGIMLGLTPKAARERYEQVIDFAELKEFENLKLKNYSSGMHVRLAFSVAIHVDAELLIMDEVLAVGDAAFQQKCFDVFSRMRDEGKTIVLVTHDMGAVVRFCHRALLLERGNAVALGTPQDVADQYLELAFRREHTAIEPDIGVARLGDGAARVTDIWVGHSAESAQAYAQQGRPLTIKVLVQFHQAVTDPSVTLRIINEERQVVIVGRTDLQHERSGAFHAGDRAEFAFSMHNMLAPGRYHTGVSIARRGSGVDRMDTMHGGLSFVVIGTVKSGGLIEVPVETAVRRRDSIPLPTA